VGSALGSASSAQKRENLMDWESPESGYRDPWNVKERPFGAVTFIEHA
jgi:hypothetical protein